MEVYGAKVPLFVEDLTVIDVYFVEQNFRKVVLCRDPSTNVGKGIEQVLLQWSVVDECGVGEKI